MCQDTGIGTHAVTHAQCNGNDGQGARGHLFLGNELDAGHHDGREHHHGSTAQNGLRHDGDQCAQLGDQAAEDQEDGTGGQCAAVDDLGHGNQAHVLAEGGVGQNAEAGGKGRAQAVADNTAGQLLIGGLAAHAALHHAGDIAHGLHSGDDEHDQHGQDSAHIKNDLDGNQLGDGKPVGLCHLAPVQHPCLGELHTLGSDTGGGQDKAHDKGCQIARHNADEDGGRTQKARGPMLEEQDHHQHEHGQQQVFRGTEVLGCVAAAKGVDTHGDQGQTDGQHHRAGDHRGEELAQGLEEEAQHSLEQAAQNGSAHDGTVGQHATAHGSSHTVEHAQEAGAGAHDNGDLTAHRADGEQLHQRDHTSHEHGVLQQADLQVSKLTACKAAGTGDDKKRGQVAHEHGKYMLQAQRDGLAKGHLGIKLVCTLLQLDIFDHNFSFI